VIEKATGAKLGEVGVASTEDVSAAAAAARKAQKEWAKLPGPNRGDVLREFSRLMLAHSKEIADQLVRETGSVRAKARWEVEMTAREFLEAAALASQPQGILDRHLGSRASEHRPAAPDRRHRHHHAVELAIHPGRAGDQKPRADRTVDLDVLVQGARLAREIGAAAAFADWRAEEIYPGSRVANTADLRDFALRAANSFHHPVGTCGIGAVVDEALRVKGVAGLRVIDASVIPEIPQAMINAATTAIAERASDLLIAG
jgi:choline dehydrogenase-like flavoprotein